MVDAHCKHGLVIDTCAYCTGLIKKPTETTFRHRSFAHDFADYYKSYRTVQYALIGAFNSENPDTE
jgi:hypothetical protein